MKSSVLSKEEFQLLGEIEGFLNRNSDGSIGAILIFIGKVKSTSKDGKAVRKLLIESYREGSNKKLVEISRDLMKRYGLKELSIIHLEGEFYPGENLVMVAASSRSRKEVFDAVAEAISRYKREAFLYKKEVYVNGTSKWISE